jgi:hypothetical protein
MCVVIIPALPYRSYEVVDKNSCNDGFTIPYDGRSWCLWAGNHNLTLADVDSMGKMKYLWILAFDDDGSLLYSTGLGQGEAMHDTDMENRTKQSGSLEVHVGNRCLYGYDLQDPRTGTKLWGTELNRRHGREWRVISIPGIPASKCGAPRSRYPIAVKESRFTSSLRLISGFKGMGISRRWKCSTG